MRIIGILIELGVFVVVFGIGWLFVGRPIWSYIKQLPSVRLWLERRAIEQEEKRTALREKRVGLLEADRRIERAEEKALGLNDKQ